MILSFAEIDYKFNNLESLEDKTYDDIKNNVSEFANLDENEIDDRFCICTKAVNGIGEITDPREAAI